MNLFFVISAITSADIMQMCLDSCDKSETGNAGFSADYVKKLEDEALCHQVADDMYDIIAPKIANSSEIPPDDKIKIIMNLRKIVFHLAKAKLAEGCPSCCIMHSIGEIFSANAKITID